MEEQILITEQVDHFEKFKEMVLSIFIPTLNSFCELLKKAGLKNPPLSLLISANEEQIRKFYYNQRLAEIKKVSEDEQYIELMMQNWDKKLNYLPHWVNSIARAFYMAGQFNDCAPVANLPFIIEKGKVTINPKDWDEIKKQFAIYAQTPEEKEYVNDMNELTSRINAIISKYSFESIEDIGLTLEHDNSKYLVGKEAISRFKGFKYLNA